VLLLPAALKVKKGIILPILLIRFLMKARAIPIVRHSRAKAHMKMIRTARKAFTAVLFTAKKVLLKFAATKTQIRVARINKVSKAIAAAIAEFLLALHAVPCARRSIFKTC
jgi:uncharacterized protein (DUF2267 family)